MFTIKSRMTCNYVCRKRISYPCKISHKRL